MGDINSRSADGACLVDSATVAVQDGGRRRQASAARRAGAMEADAQSGVARVEEDGGKAHCIEVRGEGQTLLLSAGSAEEREG